MAVGALVFFLYNVKIDQRINVVVDHAHRPPGHS